MAGIGAGVDLATDTFAQGIVKDMLRFVAGLESGASLEGVDVKAAAEDYLIRHGME